MEGGLLLWYSMVLLLCKDICFVDWPNGHSRFKLYFKHCMHSVHCACLLHQHALLACLDFELKCKFCCNKHTQSDVFSAHTYEYCTLIVGNFNFLLQ